MVEFKVTIPGWVSTSGKLAFISATLFGASEKGLFQREDRIHPIYFPYPTQKQDDVSISLPAGWQTVSLPKPQNVDLKAVLYSLNVAGEQATVHLRRELDSELELVPAQSYTPLRNFFQFVRSSDEEQVALQPGPAAANN